MNNQSQPTIWERVKTLLIGGARNPFDAKVFHHLSLVAFFAWVGLGADGLSSICYGPEEAFRALGQYPYLAIFVAAATAVTVLVISASYSQIIEQFPAGGGGYVVASKLLSPTVGMVSGCALCLDYVLTIAISIASGADAVFSFIPEQYHLVWVPVLGLVPGKVLVVLLALGALTLLNLRGVRESVVPLVPVFLLFVVTHLFVIGTAMIWKISNLPEVVHETAANVREASGAVGVLGMLFIMIKAYSLGAGTYTGIEAVSNGLPILREPRAATGKRTMRYMAVSLAVTVVGLMLAYLLFRLDQVPPTQGHQKTLNAILFERFTEQWPSPWGPGFVLVTLLSEAAILFIAAQAGFLGGPRVLSNMAQDRWFPHKFATLSDRLVTQNGVLLMSAAALATLFLTGFSVRLLVVLYAINVFLTFVLSQLGMVRHWWQRRARNAPWRKGLAINGVGLILCTFILVSVTVLKFGEGGWATILVTGGLVTAALLIRRHYRHTSRLLRRLDGLVRAAEIAPPAGDNPAADGEGAITTPPRTMDPAERTAVLMVNGFNGLGLHTLFNVVRLFPGIYRNFLFVHIGIIDAGNFKGVQEIDRLRAHIQEQAGRYVRFARSQGFAAEAITAVGTDVVDELGEMAPNILSRFPNAVFFGGQLVFPNETIFTRILHNYTVFALQRRFYSQGIPVVVLPIRV